MIANETIQEERYIAKENDTLLYEQSNWEKVYGTYSLEGEFLAEITVKRWIIIDYNSDVN